MKWISRNSPKAGKSESLPKARARAQRLPTSDLLSWSENQLSEIYADLSQWRQGGGIVALKDAEYGILILLEVCREMAAREGSSSQ